MAKCIIQAVDAVRVTVLTVMLCPLFIICSTRSQMSGYVIVLSTGISQGPYQILNKTCMKISLQHVEQGLFHLKLGWGWLGGEFALRGRGCKNFRIRGWGGTHRMNLSYC